MKARLNNLINKFSEFASTHDYLEKPILSLYLDIDPTKAKNRKDNPAWKIELKNELKQIYNSLDQEQLKRYDVQKDLNDFGNRLQTFLDEYLISYTGRSVLILSDLEDIVALDIQIPVETKAHYGMPRIEHLLYVMDKYKKYMVLFLTEAEIRVLEVYLGRVTNEVLIETNQEVKLRFGRKARTLASERRDLASEAAYAKEIADELNTYFMEDPDFERLVLSGNQKIAHNVRNRLHPALQSVLVSIEKLDIQMNEADVTNHISEIAATFEEQSDLLVIEDLVKLHNFNGAAVLELSVVAKAIEDNRIKSLVVSYPIEAEEKYELVYKASLKNNQINFVFGQAKERLDEFGGIGAFLYYS